MSGATVSGWPYVTPDDHPLEFPAHSQALANKLQLGPTAAKTFTKTTDGTGGSITVSAAEMGMTAFAGVTASVYFSTGAGQPLLCTARLTNPTSIAIVVLKAADATAATIALSLAKSVSVTVYVTAW